MERFILDITNLIIALTGLLVAISAFRHGKDAKTTAESTEAKVNFALNGKSEEVK